MKNWAAYGLISIAFTLPLFGLLFHGGQGLRALSWDAQEVFAPSISSVKHASINYGVYDPVFTSGVEKAFRNANKIAIEHIFMSWLDVNGSEITEAQQYARARGRWLMVTVEPFTDGRTVERGQFLRQVAAGAYDVNIDVICRKIGESTAPVFIRWGHEMEARADRYPWSGQPPDQYIAAYRHFVTICRNWIAKAYYVWSPRGDIGLAEYYPGKGFADYVGVSVYALPAYNKSITGAARSFLEEFSPRYERTIAFNLPLMIAELGVAGDGAYQRSWMRGLFRNAGKFPLLKTAVYFNAKDTPGVWPAKFGVPDWRISADIFE